MLYCWFLNFQQKIFDKCIWRTRTNSTGSIYQHKWGRDVTARATTFDCHLNVMECLGSEENNSLLLRLQCTYSLNQQKTSITTRERGLTRNVIHYGPRLGFPYYNPKIPQSRWDRLSDIRGRTDLCCDLFFGFKVRVFHYTVAVEWI